MDTEYVEAVLASPVSGKERAIFRARDREKKSGSLINFFSRSIDNSIDFWE